NYTGPEDQVYTPIDKR
ncbi:hypothetical protein UU5_07903, partial [Rhodanobacter sp. 115]